jgi:hypothetical protein
MPSPRDSDTTSPSYRAGQLVVEYATVGFRRQEDFGPSASEDRDSNEPGQRSDRLLDPWDTDHSEPASGRLNGPAGGSAVATIGGISAVLVSTVFLVAACLHWRFCVRHPAAVPVRCLSFRFILARPNPITATVPLPA